VSATARREELLRAEAEGWETFVALLDSVPPALLERPGLNDEGWAVRDLVWHVAFWCADSARALGEMRGGTFDRSREPDGPSQVDPVNDRELERSRAMRAEDARAELHRARSSMLERFGALGEPGADACEWFEESGALHYLEHGPRLDAWVRANRP
jgi:mycothiol maleylpyruvate isomerase-like protein